MVSATAFADAVRHDVVQLAGDPQPLRQRGLVAAWASAVQALDGMTFWFGVIPSRRVRFRWPA
jgi:hypothetical protein